jgi:Txe/YoeB family toxin of Txe-Axe toxin-antitoxin module
MKDSIVGFIDQKAREEYEKAREENPQLFKFLERATDDLKENPFCGIKIPRKLWPEYYIKKYSIDNLWKYDMPNAYRLIYTITELPAPKGAGVFQLVNEAMLCWPQCFFWQRSM